MAILPGVPLGLLVRRSPTIWTLLTDAILWSVLIDSSIAWLPLGINFHVWLAVCVVLSIVGGVVCIVNLRRLRAMLARDFGEWSLENGLITATIGLSLAGISVIALERANIDWDAVNYYLFSAVDLVASGHAGSYFSHAVTISNHAPNTIPPALPVIYAFGIGLAHGNPAAADGSIRLVTVVFILGICAAMRRLAACVVGAPEGNATIFLFLLMPATIAYLASAALYIDFPATFTSTALLAEVMDRAERRSFITAGAAASAAILTKITGLAVVLLTLAVIIWRILPEKLARLWILFFGLAMVVVSARLRFFEAASRPTLWLSIGAVIGVSLILAPRRIRDINIGPREALAFVGLLIPGALFVFRVIATTGNPAGTYISTLTHMLSPNWDWALSVLRSADLYREAQLPGLPQNYGLGLLLWWGFGPLFNLMAVGGLLLRYRRPAEVSTIALFICLFDLAWLTVFRLDDFRHLIPVTPLLCILLVYSVSNIAGLDLPARLTIFLMVVLFDVPYVWTGFETMFQTPTTAMRLLGWSQEMGLSSFAMLTIAIYCACGVLLVAGFIILIRRLSASSLRTPKWFQSVNAVLVIATCTLAFLPLIETGSSSGFVAQRAAVRSTEDFGYMAALDPVLSEVPDGSILTYKSYGVSWFSLGRVRRVELTDALDLGLLRPLLQGTDSRRALLDLERYHVTAAILPTPLSTSDLGYQRVLERAGFGSLGVIRDPLVASVTRHGEWSAFGIYPPTQATKDIDVTLAIREGRRTWPLSGSIRAVEVNDDARLEVVVRRRNSPSRMRASVHVVTSGAQSPELAEQDTTITGSNGAFISVPVAKLRPLPDGNSEVRSIVVRGFDVSNRQTDLLDFRTPGFMISNTGARFQVRFPNALILYPELLPIASISLGSTYGALRLYPAPLLGSFADAAPLIKLDIRSSPICPAGSPITVSVAGRVYGVDRPARMTRAALSGKPLVLDLGTLLGGTRRAVSHMVEIGSIEVRGAGPFCDVAETLSGEPVTLFIKDSRHARLRRAMRGSWSISVFRTAPTDKVNQVVARADSTSAAQWQRLQTQF